MTDTHSLSLLCESKMSPRVFKDGALVFWFHSYDVQVESRASVHVGRSSQNDVADAKIWLEPKIEIARQGRTLSRSELMTAIHVVEANIVRLKEAWHAHKSRTSR